MVKSYRIENHPIMDYKNRRTVKFKFNGKTIEAREGEMIATALFANGIHIFGHHHRDKSPQGIFCANGQCSQCLVIADGVPVKSCVTPVRDGMEVYSIEGLPNLPPDDTPVIPEKVEEIETDVLIVGGGPAGLAAAIELSKYDVKVIIADDKHELGGKLTLQTHNFFGSHKECYAGTRGIEIGKILSEEVKASKNIEMWMLYVYS